MRKVLHSSSANVVLVRICGPLVCALFVIFVSKGDFLTRGIFLALPFAVAALFGVSVANVEVSGGVLRYRRLLSWRPIPSEEIVDARIEWAPALGSIRLKKFLFPWGRLYFALDRNVEPNPFRDAEYPLLTYIRNKEAVSETEPSPETSPKDRAVRQKVGIAAVSGVLLSTAWQIFAPRFASPSSVPRSYAAPALETLYRLVHLLQSFPMQLAFCAVFLVVAVSKRRSPDGWLYALLSGLSLPYVLSHLL